MFTIGLRRPARLSRLPGSVWLAVAVATVVLGSLLSPTTPGLDRWHGVSTDLTELGGSSGSGELEQDVIGARGLLDRTTPYADFGPASCAYGFCWPGLPEPTYTTHPPTAFLLVLPVARLPWNRIMQIWLLGQLACLCLAAWASGLRLRAIPLLVPVLLWGPILCGDGQFTALWLTALCIAFRLRDRPFWAGVCIGIAALPKLLPAVALGYFVWRRAWSAIAGFATVWLLAIITVVLLNRQACVDYLQAQQVMTARTVARLDNGALLPNLLHLHGAIGEYVALGILAVVAWHGLRTDSWHFWEWLAVALLPICWTYSLTPLLPGLLRAMATGPLFGRAMALTALVLPAAGDYPWSTAWGITGTVRFAGLAALAGEPETGRLLPQTRALKDRRPGSTLFTHLVTQSVVGPPIDVEQR
jgi:hypothetical protein